MTDLLVDIQDGVAVLTMNRPASATAIGGELLPELLAAANALEADDSVRAVITTSSGRVWSAGADFDVLAALGPGADADELFWDGIMTGGHEQLGVSRQGRRFDRLGPGRWIEAMLDLQKPMIAAIDGAVAGGGLGLAAIHDYRIAGESTTFRAAFGGLGVGPDMGVSWFLPRLVGHAATTEILLLGRTIDAAEALDIGLVHRVAADDEVLSVASAVASQIAELPPLGVRATIRALRASADNTLNEQLALEWDGQRATFATEDARAALQAFRTKTRAKYHGR